MSTIKIRANQLSNLIGQITFEADALAESLKKGLVPKPMARQLEEVLAHSLIVISTIADTLVIGQPDALKEMSKIAKDFHANLKDINQSINKDAIH